MLRFFKKYLIRLAAKINSWKEPAAKGVYGITRYRHSDYGLILSVSVLGIITGFFVYAFHRVTEFSEDTFHAVMLSAGSGGIMRQLMIPLVAGLGGLGVGILNTYVFKNIHGEGIETVVRAMRGGKGLIHGMNSVKSIVTAAISIGSGGGAGREAPTILLGSSLGSSLGQIFNLRPQQLRVLCASGAAAAISAIFNAPLGGIVFALEVLVGELSVRAFTPIVIASVLATATARLFTGDAPLLITPPKAPIELTDYFFLALAGVAAGIVSIYFLRFYHGAYAFTQNLLKNISPVLRPAIGGLFAGALVIFLPTLLETSYRPINQAIAGQGTLQLALATIFLKPVSAAVTLGSGGAGGTFAPAMKVGAMFGFCFRILLTLIGIQASAGAYALVGAGALIAGTYYAPLTGAILIFEISRNYSMLLPLMFASVFSAFIVHRSGVRTFNVLAHIDRLQKDGNPFKK